MRLTRITPQKKRPDRRNLYADGTFLSGVSTETLARLALRVGDEIGPEQLQAILKAEELHSARAVALRLLGRRPRTEKEIRTRLREKEFADSEIATTLEDLKRSGLVDDEEFARAFVRDALSLRPAGKMLLKRKLLLLGVSRDIVDRVLAESIDGGAEESLARDLAEKFLSRARSSGRDEPQAKLRARLSAYLARRGFAWEVIQSTVSIALKDDE